MSAPLPTSDLIKLVVLAAEAASGRQGRHETAHVAAMAVVAVAAAGCAVAAIACTLAALWIYAWPRVGAAGAALIVAGVLLAMSLGLLLVLRFGLAPRPPPPPHTDAASMLFAESVRLLKENKAPVLLAALLAGLLAGKTDR